MPFIIIHDNGLSTAGAMAGNVGLYQTGQNDFRNQLAANQDARAQSSLDFQQQQQQDSGQESAYRTILSDMLGRSRLQNQNDLLGQRLGAQQDMLGQRLGTQQDIAQGHDQTRLTTSQTSNDTRQRGQDLNNQLGNDRLDETKRNNDLKNTYGYDVLQKDYDVARERMAAQQDLESAKTLEQAQRAQNRLERAAALAQIHEQIKQVGAQAARLQRSHDTAVRSFQPVDEGAYQQQMQQFQQAVQQYLQQLGASGGGGGGAMAAPANLQNMVGPGGDQYFQGQQAAPVAPQQQQQPQVDQNAVMGQALQAVQQVTQQVVTQMPGASKEAIRVEIKVRLAQMGINPAMLGIQ